ncbi:MAG: elongation factor P [Candidatus Paceibacterota bacterium]
MLEYSEIRERKIIIYEDEPCEVMENHVARTQQRKPQNQVKLKSLLSGRTWNTVFHASDKAEEATIIKKDVKFLYANRDEFWFSNPNDPKDRFKIDKKIIGDTAKFLKSNENTTALIWDNDGAEQIIKISLPIKMEFTIKDCPPSIKGSTASGGGKLAVLENGIKIQVPFFIEQGDKVIINTETGEYVERVQK